MSDWFCPTCKHMIDTPQHELGCEKTRETERAFFTPLYDPKKDLVERYDREIR